jgi:SAM-dependent methyltransferase
MELRAHNAIQNMTIIHQLKAETLASNQISYEYTHHGTVCVYENNDYVWLTFSDDPLCEKSIQGVMSKANPGQVLIAVNQSMLLFLLRPVSNIRILNMGLGTGGVERALRYIEGKLHSLFSIYQFDTVEISYSVISLVKKHFKLPDNQAVYQQCAEQFIGQCTNQYDVINIDVFNGDHHQKFIEKEPFWQAINNCLENNGQVLINLNPKTGQALQTLLELLRHYFKCIALIEFKDYKNIVLILSNLSLKHITVEAIYTCKLMQTVAPNLHNDIKKIYYIE